MLVNVMMNRFQTIVVRCRVHISDKMCRYVVITAFVLVVCSRCIGAPPLRLTIDCGLSDDKDFSFRDSRFKYKSNFIDQDRFDVDSFCKLIHNSIPKAVKDGKFILRESDPMDQEGFGDTISPISVLPPKGFNIPTLNLPKLKIPRIRVPKIKVPRLLPALEETFGPPKVGNAMYMPRVREEEDSSAERMEKFKKGVQKMLHVVKVLGQIDQYLSERTRIVIDKLSKTLAE